MTAAPTPSAIAGPAAGEGVPTDASAAPRHPVVLVHGLLGFVRRTVGRVLSVAYFQGVEDRLRARGVEVTSVALPPSASVAERARALGARIEALGDRPVNVVAHSMGGLDARWYVGRLGGHARVASLTTISTPHRGTTIADWAERRVGRPLRAYSLLGELGIDPGAFRDLTSAACEERCVALANAPEVPTFSVGGARRWYATAAPLLFSYRILQRAEGPNDGLVSAASARWGTYLGTVEADHFAQTGWHWTPPGVERFDHRAFYERIVAGLAQRGF